MKAGEIDSFKREAKNRHRKTLNRFFLERHEKNPHNESTKSPLYDSCASGLEGNETRVEQKNETNIMTHKSDHLGEDI